jgi:ribosome-binding factor A
MAHDKIAREIRIQAGEFIAREANRNALITPTRVEMSEDSKKATVYFTVLPESEEESALSFLRRKRSEFRSCLTKQRFKRIPMVDFAIDAGEKNRRALEEISSR